MQVEIRARNLELTRALQAHAERRLQFALGRFGSRIDRVVVRLADLNGPGGGVDKRCRIAVGLIRSKSVVVDDRDADLYTAVDRAADRAGRCVARLLTRDRELS